MAVSISKRPPRRIRLRPATPSGWVALGLFAFSIVLLFGRFVMTPLFNLPLNYLIVLIAVAASGLVALYAVVLRRERSLGVVAVLVVGMLAATWLAAESFGGAPATSSVTLGEGDNGQTVAVTPGSVITIRLPGNPTTGYGWEASIGNGAVLTALGSPVFEPSSSALGAGGTYTFRYKAIAAGRAGLTIVYRRSWETGTPPLNTYQVTVVVH
jgi:inhibitor of cysteine peptidase